MNNLKEFLCFLIFILRIINFILYKSIFYMLKFELLLYDFNIFIGFLICCGYILLEIKDILNIFENILNFCVI